MPKTSVPELGWTGDAEADRLVATDPLALLIGFCLDQQIPIEKAFFGPLRLRERLGTLNAAELAAVPEANFEKAFRTVPALHRFPASMAQRVQRLCAIVATDYGGDAAAIWTTTTDAKEALRRFAALPGFGRAKAQIMVAVVTSHFGAKLRGAAALRPDHPTLADVHSVEERLRYQEGKRAAKRAARAASAE